MYHQIFINNSVAILQMLYEFFSIHISLIKMTLTTKTFKRNIRNAKIYNLLLYLRRDEKRDTCDEK